ncbi:hypothetical protein [Virgisporangium aurantiacum]|uniref:YD repeat-containing protein n=1 Tax=Virgisporangium aurantiacum TaxID=175570 RepID=A0A8J3Z0F7_9ACTN|nr:hypothetical protein [Virgisporangium aurantiacum]GIJ55019.1 hypothetical protein Vau01_025350 [Virgisporangium aurantiacum]
MSRRIAALLAGLALSGTLTWSIGPLVHQGDGSVTAGTRVTGVSTPDGTRVTETPDGTRVTETPDGTRVTGQNW